MKVFIVFLLGSFFIGALPRGRYVRQRPLLLLLACVVIGASYLSTRVIG
jgi:hypothetical protein